MDNSNWMNRPLTYKDLLEHSTEDQKKYILMLRNVYNVGDMSIYNMLGVSLGELGALYNRLGLKLKSKYNGNITRMTISQKNAWNRFIKGDLLNLEQTIIPSNVIGTEIVVSNNEGNMKVSTGIVKVIKFKGKLDVYQILDELSKHIGEDDNVVLTTFLKIN